MSKHTNARLQFQISIRTIRNPAGPRTIHIPLEIFRLDPYKTPMAQSGVLIGIALLAVVSVVAFLIGRQAARGVEQFREEHHERFKGSESR
jgi:hypothetical protein